MHMHVGIVGVPYCGSTILGALLDMHPDVSATGEIDYLVRWPEFPNLSGPPECNRCGKACEVWTEEVRRAAWRWETLRADVETVFPQARVLVHSCKYPHLYTRMGSLDAAILLVRRPEACAYSSQQHLGVEPESYYASWLRRYREMLVWTHASKQCLIVSYESLMMVPERTLRTAWGLLGLEQPRDLELPAPADLRDHQFAGNGGMRSRAAIELDTRWESAGVPEPPPEVAELYEDLRLGATS